MRKEETKIKHWTKGDLFDEKYRLDAEVTKLRKALEEILDRQLIQSAHFIAKEALNDN